MFRTYRSALLVCITGLLSTSLAAAPEASKHSQAVADNVRLAVPGSVKLGGLLGERFEKNLEGRLLKADEDEMLDGFRNRPGKQDWIGEHVGKWLHASALSTAMTDNMELRAKMDRVVQALLATQDDDGYLGTYPPGNRMSLVRPFAWDVWIHKYDLMGLLAYYQLTRDKASLSAGKRIGDMLLRTFGPDGKDINSAGTHDGMAATSVLQPMVLLHRLTGETRYLDFARSIPDAWETTTGAHVISSLKKQKCVQKVGNAKSYEMLSNFVGLCELYRATGERKYLDVCLIAWNDIVANHLYITGTGSTKEHWVGHGKLPFRPADKMGEACVTVTWMQFNLNLYRLLGETRFLDQIERSVYNQLLGAQHPSGEEHCYYLPLEGPKPFEPNLTCCFSSLSRGISFLPAIVYATSPRNGKTDVVHINMLTSSSANLTLPSGKKVEIRQETDFPLNGNTTIHVNGSGRFQLKVRIPAWAGNATLTTGGRKQRGKAGQYSVISRTWKKGDRVTVAMDYRPRVVKGDGETSDRVALMIGPMVLAASEEKNPHLKPLHDVAFRDTRNVKPVSGGNAPEYEAEVFIGNGKQKQKIVLEPFYSAGSGRSPIQVWFKQSK